MPHFWCSLHTLSLSQDWFGLWWFGAWFFGISAKKFSPFCLRDIADKKTEGEQGWGTFLQSDWRQFVSCSSWCICAWGGGMVEGSFSLIAAHPLRVTHSWLLFQGFSIIVICFYSFKYLCGIAVNVIGNTGKCPPVGSQEEQVRAAQNYLFPSSYSPALSWAGWQRLMAVPQPPALSQHGWWKAANTPWLAVMPCSAPHHCLGVKFGHMVC